MYLLVRYPDQAENLPVHVFFPCLTNFFPAVVLVTLRTNFIPKKQSGDPQEKLPENVHAIRWAGPL